ncbi:MAG: hemerythrin domain-containing protein [Magnetococcales bacterium]|nr:hemerythrin domain-containing protein [Magnetococcales bacterium]
MSDIIDELKEEHTKLLDYFGTLNDVSSSNVELCKSFMIIKDFLLNHIHKEDRLIYPLLNAEAKVDSELRHQIDQHDQELMNLASIIESFSQKYCDSGLASNSAMNELDFIIQLLGVRISNEEDFIFQRYEALAKKSSVGYFTVKPPPPPQQISTQR